MPTATNFGSFLRSSRQALGLSLREFCRRNGFDPANVSRMERGLAPAPQARKLMEAYARGLKLAEGSEAWERLFELAAAETGRLPDEVLKSQQAARRLPKMIRELRPRRAGLPGGVTALRLEGWADTLDARARLPQLIRRLVRATGRDLRRVEFPAGEQVQRPGWDGIIEADVGDEFVPAGTSVWEMGVEKNPQRKAEEDLAKRTKDPLGLDKGKTTFVFVTPRKWQTKDDWCRANAGRGGWKEIRVYDSATLEEWMERSPAVEAWLAGMLGIKPAGVMVLDDYWANLQGLTEPSLSPEVFLTSREKQIEELEAWLKGPNRGLDMQEDRSEGWSEGPTEAFVIEARSPAEAIDFLAAYGRNPSRADVFAARSLIVETRDSWRAMAAAAGGGLLLIPSPSLQIEPELVAEAVRRGHRVILPSASERREPVTTIRLPRAYRHDLEKALVACGVDEEQADRLARESGGSLTVLKRLLGRFPGTTHPEWSLPSEAPAIVPMLLAGGWDDRSEADRSAMEELSGRPYREVSELAERWLKSHDPLLSRIGTQWSLVSRDDSWFLLGPAVSAEALSRFEKIACKVLAEDDPSLELPPEERWEASFLEKRPRHSLTLRGGVAETLALLGARPERLPPSAGARGLAERVVRTVLDGQPWIRWASLSPQLRVLAEAAPEVFLAALNRDLRKNAPALAKLFDERGDPLFASHPHTGLLWALEMLAWERSLLSPVSLILGKLDEMAPAMKMGNTPGRSLSEIFMPWLPQTTAPVEDRVRVLRKLIQDRPDAGWRLLVGLLPNQHQVSSPTPRPKWRDWALGWTRTVTNAAYWNQVVASSRLLVEHMGGDVARWKSLIKHFENLPEPVRGEFVGRLDEFADAELDDDQRRILSDAIRDKLTQHRRFAAADWALPDDVLADLDRLRSRFEPEDPVRKNAWVFGPRWQILETLEWNQSQDERLGELREKALNDILERCGFDGVLRLVDVVEAPNEVGVAFSKIGAPEDQHRILPHLLLPPESKTSMFARGYAVGRFIHENWDWVESLGMKGWTPVEAGQLLTLLPFGRETWDFAAAMGTEVQDCYWGNTPPFAFTNVAGDAMHAVRMLLEHRRSPAAIHVLRMALHDNLTVEPGLIMDALQGWLEAAAGAEDPGTVHGNRYDIHQLFEVLQKELDPVGADRQRLAQLEWAYIGLLDGHPASPVTLHGLLRDDPEFFVQVLGLIYRPKDVVREEEPSEEEKLRAQNAYRLLMEWEDVPGRGKEGSVDEGALNAWLRKARALAEEKGLAEITDSRIGQVFAFAPEEPDGSWPCIPVRDALDDIGTDEVFNGFEVGIYNKRGMFSKSLREGGEQERALAEKYRRYSEACQVDWPQTAASLRRVAGAYDEEARRADAEVLLN